MTEHKEEKIREFINGLDEGDLMYVAALVPDYIYLDIIKNKLRSYTNLKNRLNALCGGEEE